MSPNSDTVRALDANVPGFSNMKVPLFAIDGELAEMSFAIFNYLPVGRIADADTPR